MVNYALIEEIRKRHKISDYFTTKGIDVVSITPERIRYRCPLHNEKKPSFMLYLNGDYENYFCWGCRKAGDIISIYSQLEGKHYKDAIKFLGDGISITNEEELDLIIRKIKFDMENPISKKNAENELASLSLRFSILGYIVLEETQYNEEVIAFLEDVYKKIDDFIRKEDFTSLEESYNMIIEEKLFAKKIKKIQCEIKNIEKEKIKKLHINQQLGLEI